MASLPKLTVPLYDVTCPSGLKVSFRPFLVKEEKLLLMAQQSKDTVTIVNAVKMLLDNCVGKVSAIDVDKLPLFDVEYLFLQLRARSIGEVVNLKYKCNQTVANTVTGNTEICNKVSDYAVDLTKIQPTFDTGHAKYIQLNETIGLTLRYPTFKSFRHIIAKDKDVPTEDSFAFVVDCIESINDQNAVVFTKDVPLSDVISFVEDMTKPQIDKLDAFFDTMPKIETTLNFKCPKCGFEDVIVVKGLDSFFG
jgi:hypothetical protein